MGLNFPGSGYTGSNHPHSYHPYHQHPAYYQHQQSMFSSSYPHASGESLIGKHDVSDPKNPMSRDCGVPIPASKPKIWSLADTVASKTPPLHSAAYMAHQQHQRQNLHQQQQMSQQQSHPMQQLQQMSSLIPAVSQNTTTSNNNSNMMSGNYNTNPYTRGPSTAYENFLGAMATNNMPPYNNSNNNTANSSSLPTSNNSHHHHNSSPHQANSQQLSPNTPPTTTQAPNAHHTQLQQRAPSTTHPRGMGFPEAQPDTPPQTPPNMKMPNVQLATNLLLTATQAHMTATCHNINSSHHLSSSNPYGLGYNRSYEYSPRDENSVGSSCSSASSSSHEPESQAYKSIFKG